MAASITKGCGDPMRAKTIATWVFNPTQLVVCAILTLTPWVLSLYNDGALSLNEIAPREIHSWDPEIRNWSPELGEIYRDSYTTEAFLIYYTAYWPSHFYGRYYHPGGFWNLYAQAGSAPVREYWTLAKTWPEICLTFIFWLVVLWLPFSIIRCAGLLLIKATTR